MSRLPGTTPNNHRPHAGREESLYLWALLFITTSVSLFSGFHNSSQSLFQNVHPWGTDGYYYAYQVRSYWEQGFFSVPESSPVLYLLAWGGRLAAFFAGVFGNEFGAVETNLVMVSLLKGAIVLAAWLLARERDAFTATGFASLVASTFFLNYFTMEYVKNLGAIFFFLLYLWSLLRLYRIFSFETGNHAISKVTTLVYRNYKFIFFVFLPLLAAALLSHKIIAGMSLVMGASFFLFLFFTPGLFSRLQKAGLGGLLLLFLAAGWLLVSKFFPGFLHKLDAGRFSQSFSVFAGCSVCVHLKKFYIEYGFFIFAEALVFCLGGLFFFFQRKTISRADLYFSWGMLGIWLICLNPFLRPDKSGASFRFFLLTFLPGAWFLSNAAAALFQNWRQSKARLKLQFLKSFANHLRPSPSAKKRERAEKNKKIFRAAAAIAVAGLLGSYQLAHAGLYRSRHAVNYRLYQDILSIAGELPENSLLITHQGFDYFYWYKTRKKAFHFLPEEKHKNRPLYRLAWGVRRENFYKTMSIPQALQRTHTPLEAPGNKSGALFLPGGYALIKEETWQLYLSKITPAEKERLLTWRNPHTHRKDFLLRNQEFRVSPNRTLWPGQNEKTQGPERR